MLEGTKGKNLKIMDVQVDLEVQTEYMFYVSHSGKLLTADADIVRAQELLLAPETRLLNKKKLIARLARIDRVDVLRFLERYATSAPKDLKQFADMATFHSRTNLEMALSGEKKYIITSGMGGVGDRLRFFVAVMPLTKRQLSETQRHLIEKEFPYVFNDYNISIEGGIDFSGRYPKFTMLVPYELDPSRIVGKVITQCNELGRFLNERAIVSNVKALDDVGVFELWRTFRRFERVMATAKDEMSEFFDDDDDDDDDD